MAQALTRAGPAGPRRGSWRRSSRRRRGWSRGGRQARARGELRARATRRELPAGSWPGLRFSTVDGGSGSVEALPQPPSSVHGAEPTFDPHPPGDRTHSAPAGEPVMRHDRADGRGVDREHTSDAVRTTRVPRSGGQEHRDVHWTVSLWSSVAPDNAGGLWCLTAVVPSCCVPSCCGAGLRISNCGLQARAAGSFLARRSRCPGDPRPPSITRFRPDQAPLTDRG